MQTFAYVCLVFWGVFLGGPILKAIRGMYGKLRRFKSRRPDPWVEAEDAVELYRLWLRGEIFFLILASFMIVFYFAVLIEDGGPRSQSFMVALAVGTGLDVWIYHRFKIDLSSFAALTVVLRSAITRRRER